MKQSDMFRLGAQVSRDGNAVGAKYNLTSGRGGSRHQQLPRGD